MEMLGNYELTGHLTSQNGGYSIWGFAKRDNMDYFVKQFLSPKYPENDNVSSPQRLRKKIRQCEEFEKKKISIYTALNDNTDGNAVRVTEFFRIDSKYYISMPKIEALPWTAEDVAALSEQEVRFLCSVISHGIAGLHKGRIVHADLKHDNVLFTKTPDGYLTAKIIDFDSSFLETAPPLAGDEIIGDLVYFSPEACRSIWGESLPLTCKMDIFSLGVLFHQYFSGELPGFNREQSSYPGEAVAKGEILSVHPSIPMEIRGLLSRMLQADPRLRPTAEEVYVALSGRELIEPASFGTTGPLPVIEATNTMPKVEKSTTSGNPFYRPGSL